MQLTPVAPAIGVRVTDIRAEDLARSEVAAELLEALDRHGVLVFPDLGLDDPSFVEFARALGEPEILPVPGLEYPEIFTVSLDPEKTLSADYLKGTVYWHIDGATDDIPNMATMLYALGVASEGGETEFCNTYASWEALPDDEKEHLRGLRIVHSFEAAQRLTHPDPTDDEVAYWRLRPAKEQPLAWRHRSGRTSLVLGATADHVVGMDPEESAALIARLEAWATRPEFVYRHEWSVGELVIWDNRGTMHRAMPYAADSDRLMHRITLVGDEAFAA